MSDRPAPTYDGTLERTADGGTIRFERHLAYPVREVWDAITDPARLADWWLPFDADITVDLREGLHEALERLVPCLADRPVDWDWEAFAVAQGQYAALGFAPEVTAP